MAINIEELLTEAKTFIEHEVTSTIADYNSAVALVKSFILHHESATSDVSPAVVASDSSTEPAVTVVEDAITDATKDLPSVAVPDVATGVATQSTPSAIQAQG